MYARPRPALMLSRLVYDPRRKESDYDALTATRITLMGTEPNRPRCAWCTHPLDVHGAYGCDTDDCRCGTGRGVNDCVAHRWVIEIRNIAGRCADIEV